MSQDFQDQLSYIALLLQMKSFGEALQEVDALERNAPHNYELLYIRTQCLAALGRPDEARSCAERLNALFGDPRGLALLEDSAQNAPKAAPNRSGGMPSWRLAAAILGGVALLALVAYPLLSGRIGGAASVTEPAAAADEFAEARAVVELWAAAFEAGNVDGIMATLAEDFDLYRVGNREAVRNTLMQASQAGLLNGTQVSFEWMEQGTAVKTAYVRDNNALDSQGVIAAPLVLQSPMLALIVGPEKSYVKLKLERRGREYKIVDMDTHLTKWDF